MDWLNLLAVQGTLKSLIQHHSSKASILWSSAFFMVQLSHPYMTTLLPRRFFLNIYALHVGVMNSQASCLFPGLSPDLWYLWEICGAPGTTGSGLCEPWAHRLMPAHELRAADRWLPHAAATTNTTALWLLTERFALWIPNRKVCPPIPNRKVCPLAGWGGLVGKILSSDAGHPAPLGH